MAEQQHNDNEQEVNDRAIKWKKDADEQMQGAVELQGNNARSATEAFDKNALDLKAKYAEGLNPNQMRQYSRLIDTHHEVMRSAVISHEVSETRKAREDGIAARVETDFNTSALDGGASPSSQALIAKGFSELKDLCRSKGYDDSKIELEMQKGYDLLAKKTLDVHPELAEKMLAMNLSPEGKAYVQGKLTDIRQNETWDMVKGYRNTDGTSDLNKIMSNAESIAKSFPANQQQQVLSHVRTMANMQDAQLKDMRESSGRAFSNEVITLYKGGTPYEQAHDAIKKYAFDPTDFNNKEKILQSIYFRDSSAYERMTEYWSPAQKREWDRIKATAQKDFAYSGSDPDFKLYQNALLQEMFESKSTTPDAMQQIYIKSKEQQPTGEQRLWGILSRFDIGEKTETKAKLAISAQENQQLVDSVGGISKAIAIGRELGGMDKMAIGTPESKAVIDLSSKGYPITKKNVDFVIGKHPEWKGIAATPVYDEE